MRQFGLQFTLLILLAACAPCPPAPPAPPPITVEVPAPLPPGQPAPCAIDPSAWLHAPAEGREAWVPGGWTIVPQRDLDALAREVYLWRAWGAAALSGGE